MTKNHTIVDIAAKISSENSILIDITMSASFFLHRKIP
jgi:hypothetical protein